MMFKVYLGDWHMGSGETEEQAMENAISEAYTADLIGTEFPRLSEGEFVRSVDVYAPKVDSQC